MSVSVGKNGPNGGNGRMLRGGDVRTSMPKALEDVLKHSRRMGVKKRRCWKSRRVGGGGMMVISEE